MTHATCSISTYAGLAYDFCVGGSNHEPTLPPLSTPAMPLPLLRVRSAQPGGRGRCQPPVDSRDMTENDELWERFVKAQERQAAADEARVLAYRERTDFFRSTMPVIGEIQEQNKALQQYAESMQDTLAEAGIGKAKVRVKKD